MTVNDVSSRAAPLLHHDVQFVEVRGHRLEYLDIPAHRMHRPALLFLHEGLGSVALWRDFPMNVASVTGCRTVVYSRYGFGRSSPRDKPYTPDFIHAEASMFSPRSVPSSRSSIRFSSGIDRRLHGADPRQRGGVGCGGRGGHGTLTFVEDFNLDSIRRSQEVYRTTAMREKLARYHDDVDGVFWGWNDIWLHRDFRSWGIEDDLPGVRCRSSPFWATTTSTVPRPR